MFSTSDTIVAVATPPGRGAIGVVRLSGPDAGAILRTLTGRDTFDARHATLATVAGIDRAIVTRFPAPHSYTGEDVVEISAHGSPVVLRTIVEAAIAGGARLAEPGEFTLRAYLAGRLDLPQAEAVADLVDAVTPLQARAAFDQLDGTLSERIAAHDAALFDLIARLEASVDFPDEGYHFVEPCRIAGELDALIAGLDGLIADGTRGRLVREGLQAVIAGKPNVGKSSLFNALAGAARAIVTPIPGTTRDLVTEVVDVNGVRATLVDTAGQRAAADPIEAQGVARARGAGAIADLVLVVVDGSAPLDADDRAVLDATAGRRRLIVMNKIDLGRDTSGEGRLQPDRVISVSALTGAGLDDLRAALADALDAEPRRDTPAITNVRHVTLVTRAREALARARAAAAGATGALPEEFVLADLQDARAAFEEITGRRTPDDVLAHIFERFCVGK